MPTMDSLLKPADLVRLYFILSVLVARQQGSQITRLLGDFKCGQDFFLPQVFLNQCLLLLPISLLVPVLV